MPPSAIGPYQIVRELGRGGMGEVHLARDPRLDRLVALKALPPNFAADPDRLARFQREAKVLAALNHPSIGAIYGIEEAAGAAYLVLEYVEGETLEARLSRGPLPPHEALALALQAAAALESAHEKGIIHRDLKPANLMVTEEGVLKVLDFGLARGGDLANASSVAAGDAPTIPVGHSPTMPGAIMGSAGYMSPEQARGKPIDKRSDIFSFGCVIFEMLTGTRPFVGETVTDVLAATLHREVALDQLPPPTPGRVRTLLREMLAKDPKQRVRDMGDVRLALEHAGETEASVLPAAARWSRAAWSAAGALALVCGLLGYLILTRPAALSSTPREGILRTAINNLPGRLIDVGSGPVMLSPDGRTLAFVAGPPGETMLFVRPLDSLATQPLRGTEGAEFPFWSPDSRQIGFFAREKLRRIPATGGEVIPLADAESGRGGAWSTKGLIVYAPRPFGPLMRINAAGGTATAVTEVSAPRQTHRLPCFLPDGDHLIYTRGLTGFTETDGEIMLHDLSTNTAVRLLKAGSQGVYSNGSLLYLSGGSLLAQHLDVAGARLTGESTVVAEGVATSTTRLLGAFSVSSSGAILYQPAGPLRRLEWFDMAGGSGGPFGEPADFRSLDLAPTNLQVVAIVRREDGKYDIWVCDAVRGTRARVVEHVAAQDEGSRWNPAADQVSYWDRSGKGHVLDLESHRDVAFGDGWVNEWSRDGKQIILCAQDPATGMDLFLIKADALAPLPPPGVVAAPPRAFLNGPDDESHGVFSPDGKWVAYSAYPQGREELMAVRVTGGQSQQITSTGVGKFWTWLDDGTLAYSEPSGSRLMGVDANFSEGIRLLPPRRLFARSELPSDVFALTRDGKRMLAAVPVGSEKGDSLVLVQNALPAPNPQR
ncbi:hypothetical protein BH11PLA1_BH11PLA1_08520 [soil metagenome]